ncbi:hypothetical protein PIB30_041363 [Stylosanthes scabra]|uniref:Uncharacterized protein n=1 Tax=Stylosanthes scabra TaxID=79078 RepID=A0ABU6ZDM1_9FABA|nr:hypothetical protein [Stylosanthes scabra]
MGRNWPPSKVQHNRKLNVSTYCPSRILGYQRWHAKFTIPGASTFYIYKGIPLEIEFIKKPNCMKSSKWIVFHDFDVPFESPREPCVGIGGPEEHPETHLIWRGTFRIEKYNFGYKGDEAFEIAFYDTNPYNNVTRSAV